MSGLASLASADELIQARAALLVEAVAAPLLVRNVLKAYYDAGDLANTPDGCYLFPGTTEYTALEDKSVVCLSYPLGAPREEISALLRHMITALETDALPVLPSASGEGDGNDNHDDDLTETPPPIEEP